MTRCEDCFDLRTHRAFEWYRPVGPKRNFEPRLGFQRKAVKRLKISVRLKLERRIKPVELVRNRVVHSHRRPYFTCWLLSKLSHTAVTLYSTSARSTAVRPLYPTSPTQSVENVGGSSSPGRTGRGKSKENENAFFGAPSSSCRLGLRSIFLERIEAAKASRKDVAERGLLLSPEA